jgi:hypothetical protein
MDQDKFMRAIHHMRNRALADGRWDDFDVLDEVPELVHEINEGDANVKRLEADLVAARKLIDSLEDTSKAGSDEMAKMVATAKKTVHHVLNAICDEPSKYWLMGPGTESYRLLTETVATLFGRDLDAVCKEYVPEEKRLNRFHMEREQNEEILDFCRNREITPELLQDMYETHKIYSARIAKSMARAGLT